MVSPDKFPGGGASQSDVEKAARKAHNVGIAPDSKLAVSLEELNNDKAVMDALKVLMDTGTPIVIRDVQKGS